MSKRRKQYVTITLGPDECDPQFCPEQGASGFCNPPCCQVCPVCKRHIVSDHRAQHARMAHPETCVVMTGRNDMGNPIPLRDMQIVSVDGVPHVQMRGR